MLTNVPDLKQPPASSQLWGAEPAMIYTDGLYIEKERQPGYAAAGNMAGRRGTLSFWLKPNYDKALSSRIHLYVNHTRLGMGIPGSSYNTVSFLVANAWSATKTSANPFPPEGFGFQWENAYGDDADPVNTALCHEAVCQTPLRTIVPHRWYLLTCFWDMLQPTSSAGMRLYVDEGVRPENVPGLAGDAQYNYKDLTGPALDFTQPDASGPSIFYLGRRGNNPEDGADVFDLDWWGAPDATFDEFALYDFGSVAGDALVATQVLAQDRFSVGRFYKESDYNAISDYTSTAGRYLSAPFDMGVVRLRTLAWTQVVPRGLKAPLPAGGQAGIDGDPGPDGRILLELADAAGTDYLKDTQGTAIDTRFTQDRGQVVNRLVSAPFRLHAVFKPNLATPLDTPILDPLALDDVTVIYQPVTGARMMAWREGE